MSKSLNFFIILLIVQISISYCASCKEGSKNCVKCNPVTKFCEKCDKNVFRVNSNGECEPSKRCELGKNYCFECNEEGNLCIRCEEGYYQDENGGCSYSDHCQVSYRGKCLKCKSNFVLNEGVGICKSSNNEDFQNCLKINKTSGLCQECKENFYLNEGDKKCISTPNCTESSFGICNKCASGFYLDKIDNECKKQKNSFINCKTSSDGVTCDICDDDHFFDEQGKCVNTKFCYQSNGKGVCKKCSKGYYLLSDDKICTPEKNCIEGRGDIGACIACPKNYAIDFSDGMCKSNKENTGYKNCEIADGHCTKCIAGFELGKDNKCASTSNCDHSQFSICIQCIDNYTLGIDNICTDVEHCLKSYEYECLKCEENYYYNRDNKTCFIAEGKYKNCQYGITDFCLRCNNNYYLNRSNHLCYSNSEKNDFYKCALTDFFGEHCFVCEEGYYLGSKDYKCSRVEDCDITEDLMRCSECRENFCLNAKTGLCIFNYEITDENKKFYYKCKRTNEEGNKCQVCMEGYSLDETGICVEIK